MKNATFSETTFRRSNLSGADFTGADLTKLQFHETNIDGANFEDTDLSGAMGFNKLANASKLTWKKPKPLVKKPHPSINVGTLSVLMKILTGSAFAAIGQLEDSDDDEDDDDPNEVDEEEEEATKDNPDSDDDGLGDVDAMAEQAKTTSTGKKIFAMGEEVSIATKLKMIDAINKRVDKLQSASEDDSEMFKKFRSKLDKALKSKKAKMVNNTITALTGISAQTKASYVNSLILAGNTPASKMKKQLGELTYLMERITKTTEPVLLATLSDSSEDWKSLYELQNEVKGEKARLILTLMFADPGVILALGLAEQLNEAKAPPPGFLKVVKEGLSGHTKQNYFKYRNEIMKEEGAIERVLAKQQQIIALGVSLFTSVMIAVSHWDL
ncbi:hypothetical protein TL16_g01064 [Triparma laevis f. inornata]|uniref:Pentapeptide repeat-containing protein n=1 Tax=Triparma laevis f. inornata TaxID=1714386 RepID=A0A9W7DRJ8_9STRA|nr:hypothetical protein TL16_g01064 [Triparma laevis f. inornata]